MKINNNQLKETIDQQTSTIQKPKLTSHTGHKQNENSFKTLLRGRGKKHLLKFEFRAKSTGAHRTR